MNTTRHYAGHNADGSSVQKHSCGSSYPYIVQRRDSILESAPHHSRTTVEVLSPSGAVVAFRQCHADDPQARLAAWEQCFEIADELATVYRARQAAIQRSHGQVRDRPAHAFAEALVKQAYTLDPPQLGRVNVINLTA